MVPVRPRCPALTQTPYEAAGKVSHTGFLLLPDTSHPRLLEKASHRTQQPQRAGPSQPESVQFGGQSQPGPGDSVLDHHSIPSWLLTQAPCSLGGHCVFPFTPGRGLRVPSRTKGPGLDIPSTPAHKPRIPAPSHTSRAGGGQWGDGEEAGVCRPTQTPFPGCVRASWDAGEG